MILSSVFMTSRVAGFFQVSPQVLFVLELGAALAEEAAVFEVGVLHADMFAARLSPTEQRLAHRTCKLGDAVELQTQYFVEI